MGLVEKLAKLEHEQWCHWINFQLKECAVDPETMSLEEEEEMGDKWDAWVTLAQTPYEKLTEKQKESDRKWARKVIELVKQRNIIVPRKPLEKINKQAEEKLKKHIWNREEQGAFLAGYLQRGKELLGGSE